MKLKMCYLLLSLLSLIFLKKKEQNKWYSFKITKVTSVRSELYHLNQRRREWQSTLNILAWKIPRTEEPGRLQSMGSQRVGHN